MQATLIRTDLNLNTSRVMFVKRFKQAKYSSGNKYPLYLDGLMHLFSFFHISLYFLY